MPCKVGKLITGTGEVATVIACSRGRRPKNCSICGRPGGKLCDYPLHGAKEGQTCDRSLCASCATHVEPDTDFCPTHARIKGLLS